MKGRVGKLAAPQTIGLLIIDGTTLAEVTPICDYLERLGTPVIVIVPTGSPLLPTSCMHLSFGRGAASPTCVQKGDAGDL